MEEPPVPTPRLFSAETHACLQDIGETLQRIHNRLISEGYIIKDGQIFDPVKKSNE